MERVEAIQELQCFPRNNCLDGTEIEALTLAIDTLKRIEVEGINKTIIDAPIQDSINLSQAIVTYLEAK